MYNIQEQFGKRGIFMEEALFLDRDGIINEMVFYHDKGEYDAPQIPDDVKLVEGIATLVLQAKDEGLLVVEISNRPEVAKGKLTLIQLEEIEQRIHRLLGREGARIDRYYHCLHHPKGQNPVLSIECDCRKPRPGLLLRAGQELDIDLSKSIFLGDGDSDVQAGKTAGCKTILLLHDKNTAEKVTAAHKSPADFRISSLRQMLPLATYLG